jgi:hypothetical protein
MPGTSPGMTMQFRGDYSLPGAWFARPTLKAMTQTMVDEQLNM